VRCAVEIQNAMVERNAGVPEDRRIEFRIGIHLGDVVVESDASSALIRRTADREAADLDPRILPTMVRGFPLCRHHSPAWPEPAA
jgi:hypothetical protein